MKKLIPAASGGPEGAASDGTSRRAFLQAAGAAAAGAAVILATPKVASLALDGAGARVAGCSQRRSSTEPSGPAPREPVTAYVRDADRGEVTVTVRQAGDHLQGPGAREAAARRSPLTRTATKKERNNDMSSHREAPEISKDPVADNTDTYAFVSPDNPETVTIITNYLPAEVPAGGPTFFEFGNDVLYKIHIDNDGDGLADIVYEFTSKQDIANPTHVPLQHGTDRLADRRELEQTPVLHRRARGPPAAPQDVLAKDLACPPCNIGPRSTPNYETLEQEAIHSLAGGQKVFAGQRNDPFFVDIGSIFDLADLRPIENLHLIPTPATLGVDTPGDAQLPHDRDPGPDQPA